MKSAYVTRLAYGFAALLAAGAVAACQAPDDEAEETDSETVAAPDTDIGEVQVEAQGWFDGWGLDDAWGWDGLGINTLGWGANLGCGANIGVGCPGLVGGAGLWGAGVIGVGYGGLGVGGAYLNPRIGLGVGVCGLGDLDYFDLGGLGLYNGIGPWDGLGWGGLRIVNPGFGLVNPLRLRVHNGCAIGALRGTFVNPLIATPWINRFRAYPGRFYGGLFSPGWGRGIGLGGRFGLIDGWRGGSGWGWNRWGMGLGLGHRGWGWGAGGIRW